MMKRIGVVIGIAGLLVGGAGAQGADRVEDQVLAAVNPQFQDFTGELVDVSGDWVFVASRSADFNGVSNAGKVTVFRRTVNGFEWFQELTSDVPLQSEAFSQYGIDADGDVLVVASYLFPNVFTRTGKAYVFRFNGTLWGLETTLEPGTPPGPPYLDYGAQVRVVGDSIFVSAPGLGPSLPGGGQSWRGGFYEYQRVNGVWALVQVWESHIDLGSLGVHLVTDGETLVLRGPGSLFVFMFERSSQTGLWYPTQILREGAGVVNDNGSEFAIEGDLLAMGADEHQGLNPGRVMLYRRIAGVWTQDQMILNPDPNSPSAHFGKSVDLRNGRLLVGNTWARAPGSSVSSGSAYLFEQNAQGDWVEVYRLHKSSGNSTISRMGTSVALGEDFAIVGDPIHEFGFGNSFGAAFAFDLPLGTEVCAGLANSTGSQAWLEALGSHRAESGFLRLRAGDMVPGQMAMFLAGETSGYVLNPGGHGGALCLGGRIARFNRPGQLGVADPSGGLELVLDTNAIPVNPMASILAGQTWVFQCWYRDANAGFQSNFSGAIEVQFE